MRSRPHRPCISISAASILLVACACGQSSGEPSPPPPTGDGHGPEIACTIPAHGAILTQAPGEITLTGTASDADGVAGLTVNGAPVAVGASGTFSIPLEARWGINLVTLSAADRFGSERRATCTFLLSETWATEDAVLEETITVVADQSVFDDGTRVGTIGSLADILHAVLNSTELRTSLDLALTAANPLKPLSCDQTVFPGICVLKTRVQYVGIDVQGPNTTSLLLESHGLRGTATASNVRLRLRVDGEVAGVPFDTTGWVAFSTVSAGMALDFVLSPLSKLDVELRPGSVTTNIGTVTTEFGGVAGAVLDIVVSVAQGKIRSTVADVFRDYAMDFVPAVLDELMATFDIHDLDVEVPRLDGTGSIAMQTATAFSTAGAPPTRTVLGIGFLTVPAHDRPTLGAPIPGPTLSPTPPSSRPFAATVHVGVLGQALHALWRGGYFDVTLGDGALGGLLAPAVTLAMTTDLPPAIRLLDDGRVEIGIGAVSARLTDPSVAAAPVDLVAGARASCAVSLGEDRLVLGDCTIDDLSVSPTGAALGAEARAKVDTLLASVLEQVTAASGNAQPTLPVPAFTVPSSYGLPGGELGLVSPALSTSGDHLVLTGSFGVR